MPLPCHAAIPCAVRLANRAITPPELSTGFEHSAAARSRQFQAHAGSGPRAAPAACACLLAALLRLVPHDLAPLLGVLLSTAAAVVSAGLLLQLGTAVMRE